MNTKNFIKSLNEEYIDNHLKIQERDILIQEYNNEKSDTKGYHGREILELLQNADDAYEKEKLYESNEFVEVLIEYHDSILTISNTGTVFDSNGIKSIIQGNNSYKDKKKYIGNKGTGFHSVLNWSEEISIHSGNFNILFSKEIVQSEFELYKEKPQIKKQVDRKKDLCFNILSLPKEIKEIDKNGFDTVIKVKIKDDLNNDSYTVENQLNNLNARTLLFLRNINKITVKTNDKFSTYIKNSTDEKDLIKLSNYHNYKEDQEELFYKYDEKCSILIDDIEEDVYLALAIPKCFSNFNNEFLYSFFPVNAAPTPFNCIMHATYELGSSRNTIECNKVNEEIMKLQLSFLVKTAIKFQSIDYNKSIRLLIPRNFKQFTTFFLQPFSNMKSYYINLLKEYKIFKSINNIFLSLNENPKFLNIELPLLIHGSQFDNIIKSFDKELVDLNIYGFLKELNNEDYLLKEKILCDIVSDLTGNWSIKQEVEIFDWWDSNFQDTLPRLIKNSNGEYVKYKEDCFFIENDSDLKIPNWVNLNYLNIEYQRELISIASTKDKILQENKTNSVIRSICHTSLYNKVNFRFKDKSSIAKTINTFVDDYEKSIEFVLWLWKNDSRTFDYIPNFPSYCQTVVKSNKLYLGNNYGYNISEKLFDKSFSKFEEFSAFNIDEEEKQNFINFLYNFKISSFPNFEKITVKNELYLIEQQKSYLNNDFSNSSTKMKYFNVEVDDIMNLESIIANLQTIDIIEWLINDSKLNYFLKQDIVRANISFQGNKQNSMKFHQHEVKNYILYIFNNTKWVDINNQRYSPIELLNCISNKQGSIYSELVPCLTSDYINFISSQLNKSIEDIKDIFELFDLNDSIIDFNSNIFYDVLLKSENLPTNVRIKLYKNVFNKLETSKKIEFSNCKEKDEFFKKGFVLARYQNKLDFFPCYDVCVPSTNIISISDTKIVDKGLKTGNAPFINILNCKEYKEKYSVIQESIIRSKYDNSFQIEYNEFIKYARRYGEQNENISNSINSLRITLVENIEIFMNDTIVSDFSSYSLLKSKNNCFYIVIHGLYNKVKLSKIIEVIFQNIANSNNFEQSRIGELFRSDEETRKDLIINEFGETNFEEVENSNSIMDSFLNLINQVNSSYFFSNEINFGDFQSFENKKYILKVLKDLSVDIKDLIKYNFYHKIDLIPYYTEELNQYIALKKDYYSSFIYEQCLNGVIQKNDFINKKNEFIYFSKEYEFENSIYVNIEEIVKEKFNDIPNEIKYNVEEIYKKNLSNINNNKLKEKLINNNSLKISVYFNDVKDINSSLEEDISNDEFHEESNITLEEGTIHPSNAKGKKKSVPGGYNPRTERSKQRVGMMCEQYALKYLKEMYDNVEAVSEISAPSGLGISGTCDLTYKIGDKTYYVEVKHWNNGFIMTENEIKFAEENPNYYEIFLVFDIYSSNVKYKIIKYKDFKNKDLFEITPFIKSYNVKVLKEF